MNVKDLNGNFTTWSLTGHIANSTIDHKSSYHIAARQLIRSLFPTLQILEEVPISVRKSEILYLDFYLPLKKMCIEVHGEQHYKFVSFYHNSILDFVKAQKRDKYKQEWCEINNISYVSLPYNETLEEWTKRLNDK
jgi:hypothetical protein